MTSVRALTKILIAFLLVNLSCQDSKNTRTMSSKAAHTDLADPGNGNERRFVAAIEPDSLGLAETMRMNGGVFALVCKMSDGSIANISGLSVRKQDGARFAKECRVVVYEADITVEETGERFVYKTPRAVITINGVPSDRALPTGTNLTTQQLNDLFEWTAGDTTVKYAATQNGRAITQLIRGCPEVS